MKTAQTSQDLLLSIFEKGVAHSTEKLTALSGTDWAIHIISIDVGAGERFRTILARDQRDYLGVSFSSPGERYLVIFSEESGKALLAASANEHPGGISAAKNMERASLAEIANILINGLSGEFV
jgi:chemotaxis protein CheY-P-specific phosphatase CheC